MMKKEKAKDNICKGECKKYAIGMEVYPDAGGERSQPPPKLFFIKKKLCVYIYILYNIIKGVLDIPKPAGDQFANDTYYNVNEIPGEGVFN